MILNALFIIGSLGLSIVLHELGHALAYRLITGKWLKLSHVGLDYIEIGKQQDFFFLKNNEKHTVLSVGIVLGMVGLIPTFLFVGGLPFVSLAILYTIGCSADFRELYRLKK